MCIPLHSLRTLFIARSDDSKLLPQGSNFFDGFADVRRQAGSDSPANNICHSRTVSAGADHNLQGTISVLTSKVEVALWGYICNVCNNPLLFTQLPNHSRGFRVVDSGHDHGNVGVVEIGGFESAIKVFDKALVDTVGDLIVEAFTGTDQADFGVGVEEVQDATSGYLDF